jgi:hypothetical protein
MLNGEITVRHLHGAPSDYDSLLEAIGEVHFVLIGEAPAEHTTFTSIEPRLRNG